ncbi:MAG: SDR family NAD(P)-dependent oxidoreductase [Oscillospiraceae bacterium]|nr:SDR family NAD(P)-dependent oxidoreductase [Oscillospiraceae bacterium]
MNIAVITGASSGMGREFVLQLDKQQKFDEIWVIARREDRLRALETRSPLRVLPMDLTDRASYDKYSALLEQENPNIRVLVNASGYGKFEPYDKVSFDDAMGIIDLNCKALIAMCHLSLPYMQEGAEIYNLGSMSAFQPTPFMLNYASSKALVVSYSRGLNVELRGRKIKVMAVCPGWVVTEFFDKAQEKDKTSVNYFNVLYKPEDVVSYALKDMKKGKDLSVLGLPVKGQRALVKLMPAKMVMNTWLKQQSKKK